jgi:hypothetical protein
MKENGIHHVFPGNRITVFWRWYGGGQRDRIIVLTCREKNADKKGAI